MKKIFTNWKTTTAGVVSILLIILVNSGEISLEESSHLSGSVNLLVNHIDGIVAIIFSIALIFSKDADAKD